MALNETLSPRQAQQIAKQFEDVINRIVRNITAGFDTFFEDMQREWEDKYAVELSQKLIQALEEISEHLKQNATAFNQTLDEICKAYAKTGGMSVAGISAPNVAKISTKSGVKDTFDGDMFGFKNIDSHDKIVTSIKELVSKLGQSISEASSGIKGINAFGNPDVIANLAVSGGKVVEILQDAIKQVESSTAKNLEAAATAYRSTGSNAVEAANIQAG